MYTYKGETHTGVEWAKKLNISYKTFLQRLRSYKKGKMPIDKMFSSKKLRLIHGELNGHKYPRLYRAWHHMGDLGKENICPEWRHDFASFRNWAKANGYDEDSGMIHFIRKNKTLPFGPDNTIVSPLNAHHRVFLTHNGVTMCISDWARYLGTSKQLLSQRIMLKHMPIDEALTKGLKPVTESTFDYQ